MIIKSILWKGGNLQGKRARLACIEPLWNRCIEPHVIEPDSVRMFLHYSSQPENRPCHFPQSHLSH